VGFTALAFSAGDSADANLHATSLLLPLFLSIAGLYFGWRWWHLSAEIDDSELRVHGLLYSQTFDLQRLGGVQEVYHYRSRYYVIVDTKGETLAHGDILKMFTDFERLLGLIRRRAGRSKSVSGER
jgi:hypothetical protein